MEILSKKYPTIWWSEGRLQWSLADKNKLEMRHPFQVEALRIFDFPPHPLFPPSVCIKVHEGVRKCKSSIWWVGKQKPQWTALTTTTRICLFSEKEKSYPWDIQLSASSLQTKGKWKSRTCPLLFKSYWQRRGVKVSIRKETRVLK